MIKLKFLFLFVAISICIPSASTKLVALEVTLSKAICKQMTNFKASTTIQPALQDKDESLQGCGWVHWKQCTEGKDCSSFAHKPQQNCPPEGEAGSGSVPSSPPSPPAGAGGSGTGSAPSSPPSPPPSGGGGSSGTVKAGRIHISRSLSQSICNHMKGFQSSKKLQDPLNDKDKFASGDQECSWLHWQKCEPRGTCDSFVQKACNEVKVPSSPPSPPAGADGSGTGSSPSSPSSPPPSGGGGSSGTVKAGRIHISRSLAQSICTHMKGFQSSKKLQEPLNDKDKFASGDQECSWLHWQKCEPRGTCENFVQKACNDVKVPSG